MKLFALMFLTLGFISATENGTINWSSQKLSWDQFRKRAGHAGYYHAFTYTGIRFELTEKNGNSHINVEAFFDPAESWVHPEHLTKELLNHEQRHFDLAEIFARAIMEKASEYSGIEISAFMSNGSADKVKKIYSELTNELFLKQQRYDVETMHGKNKEKQMEWDTWIDGQLAVQ